MRQACANYPGAFEGLERNEEGEIPFDEAKASLGIIGLFDNVNPDAGGYRAAAEVLLNFEHIGEAEKTCRQALASCEPSDLEFFRSSSALSKILLDKRKTRDEALAIATKAAEELANHDVPPALKRTVYTTKARAEAKLGHEDAALQSFADAKAADPEGVTPGADLVDELTVLDKRTDRSEYIRVLKSWGLLERITWLAWNYEDDGEDRHALFCDIAVEQGEEAFIVSFYQDVVGFLDNLNAGLPLRLDLALVYFEVCNDPARALEELDKVFESHAPALQFPITGVASSWALQRAVDVMVNVQVALFRSSRDPAVKAERIAALTGLMGRHFTLDVPRTSSFWTGQQRVGLAYMHLVVGPLNRFQMTLQSLLDDCFAGLGDSVGWNDGPFLWILAQCLALLGKALRDDESLRRKARIVGSALFSKLTPGNEDEDKESEGGADDSSNPATGHDKTDKTASDEDDDAASVISVAPDDEGDLADETFYSCGGFCCPAKKFSWWKDRSTYFYVTHVTGMICEDCQREYDLLEQGKGTVKRRYFHGITHDRFKLPIEGWKGVTDGVLHVEGDEPIKVDDFFQLVKEECARGFDRLWAGM
jgi:tetratricopeptide (TPR) repeat protein